MTWIEDLGKARAQIVAQAGKLGPSSVLVQSFPKIALREWAGRFPVDDIEFADIFAGRIFSTDGEVRWIQEDGRVSVEFRAVDEERHRHKVTRYYLWGQWDQQTKGYTEQVVDGFPGYGDLWPGNDMDRPYVEVVEYLAAAPQPGSKPAEIMAALNQPRVIAHRFRKCGISQPEER